MAAWLILAVGTVLTGSAPVPPASTSPVAIAQAGTDTVLVKMVNKGPTSFAFEPARVTVHPGDVVRFVQTGAVPHDVAFTKGPSGAKLDGLKAGPMLLAKGQTYDLAIDGRFTAGEYTYECLPHAALGMKGSIDVAARTADEASGGPR